MPQHAAMRSARPAIPRIFPCASDSCAVAIESMTTLNPSLALVNESKTPATHLPWIQSSASMATVSESKTAGIESLTVVSHLTPFLSLAERSGGVALRNPLKTNHRPKRRIEKIIFCRRDSAW